MGSNKADLIDTKQLPQEDPASDWFVVAESPEAQVAAFHHAETLRNSAADVRVELDLGDRNKTEIQECVRTCRIKNVVWVKPDGQLLVEKN